jgi:small subunit ribosomal protein S21
LMANEGMLQRWKLTRRYERPTIARRRINYERSRAIYNEDMQNRIRFIMRTNRKDPYPGA